MACSAPAPCPLPSAAWQAGAIGNLRLFGAVHWPGCPERIIITVTMAMFFTIFMQTWAVTLAQAGPTAQPAGDETNFVIWGIVLITLAIGLFVIEIFVPSGGLLGIGSATALIAGIICLFLDNAALGLVAATLALLALPFAVGFALKIWPHTPIGRALILQGSEGMKTTAGDEADDGETDDLPVHPAARGVEGLVAGAQGRALSDLRPVGICVFEGRREECLASNGIIAAGTPVRIVAIDGMHVKVKAVER